MRRDDLVRSILRMVLRIDFLNVFETGSLKNSLLYENDNLPKMILKIILVYAYFTKS